MRVTLRSLAAVAALLVAAACGEAPSAPSATSNLVPTNRAPSFDLSARGDQTTTFTLTSDGGTFNVGLFQVAFPAGSVCDPALTEDIPSQWNQPCVTLSAGQSIKVTATVRATTSGLGVDFQPGLRFAPNAGVTISTYAYAPIILLNRAYFQGHPTSLRPLALNYTPTLGGATVSDYLLDRSLVTHIDLGTGRVWRRVWHFSGYSITSGQACDPSPSDPDCVDDGNGI